MAHPLDRPVWNALNSGWSGIARGDGKALALLQDYGPFAATADASPESLAALARLLPEENHLWVVEKEAFPVPPGATLVRTAILHQMAARHVDPVDHDLDIIPLTDADGPEMLALATLTEPGPFRASTHRFGGFIGIREKDRLVSMAGQRMKLDGFTEVSGVCTHPDFRGRGYAGVLMREVARAILARGEIPFLHVYASNAGAIALYETLGFALRSPMAMTALSR